MLDTDQASLLILANARKVCGAACADTKLHICALPLGGRALARRVCGHLDAAPPAASFVKSKRPKLSEPTR